MVSVSTQLSRGTLRDPVRSKGTQATVACLSVGTETLSGDLHLPLTSTPIKGPGFRLCVEEDEEDSSTEFLAEPLDTSYSPGHSLTEESEISFGLMSRYSDQKYLVFESCLRELFDTCPVCKSNCGVQRRRMGTYVAFNQQCSMCNYAKRWQSQPVVGSSPIGNLLLSAATYFTGASFIQVAKIFKAMQLQVFKYDTFRRHARNFLEPAIVHKWKTDQLSLFQQLHQGGKVAVCGDMRADSPGHSAKYGSYSVMHMESNTIIDLQLVQSNEVGGSYHMEKEGLKRSLDLLEHNDVDVDFIVTDRHPQIQKYLRERKVTQYYDGWHFEKGLSKKPDKLAQSKDCEVLKKWLRSIKHHVYWSATSSTSGPEKVAKWTSMLNHIQDVHMHEDPLFPKCAHPDRVSRDPSKWLQPGSMVVYKVNTILNNKRVLKDVGKLSHHYQTSSLEAFHSLILRFAPKNVVFPFMGMLCRLYLASMHFNENADRKQATTTTGQAVFKVVFPKSRKGECTAKPVKTAPTYRPSPFVEGLKMISIPADLSSQYEGPPKEDVVARHVSRFSQGAAGTLHTLQQGQETPGVSGAQHTTG